MPERRDSGLSLRAAVGIATIAAGLSAAGTWIGADVDNTSLRECFAQLTKADTACDIQLDRLERGYGTILYTLCTQLNDPPAQVPSAMSRSERAMKLEHTA